MAKKLRLKIPKRIAGVKIPKTVRKGPVGQFLNSSAGQIVLAEVLVVLGGAFAARRSDSALGDFMRHPARTASELGHTAAVRSRQARDTISDESDRVSHALRQAVHAFRDAMSEQPSRGEDAASNVGDDDAHDDALAATPVATEPTRAKKNRSPTQQSGTPGENPSTPH